MSTDLPTKTFLLAAEEGRGGLSFLFEKRYFLISRSKYLWILLKFLECYSYWTFKASAALKKHFRNPLEFALSFFMFLLIFNDTGTFLNNSVSLIGWPRVPFERPGRQNDARIPRSTNQHSQGMQQRQKKYIHKK